ncbi:MAG: hypothetical protein U0132_05605 [Gemmatimonadaceae bacterium]
MSQTSPRRSLAPFNIALLGTCDDSNTSDFLSRTMARLRERVPTIRFVYLLGESAESALSAVLSGLVASRPNDLTSPPLLRQLLQQVDLAIYLGNGPTQARMKLDLRAVCEAHAIELLEWDRVPGAAAEPEDRDLEARALADTCEQVFEVRQTRARHGTDIADMSLIAAALGSLGQSLPLRGRGVAGHTEDEGVLGE